MGQSNGEVGVSDIFEMLYEEAADMDSDNDALLSESTLVAPFARTVKVARYIEPSISDVYKFIESSGIDVVSTKKNEIKYGSGAEGKDRDDFIEIPIWYIDLDHEPVSEKEVEDALVVSLNRYGVTTAQQVASEFGRTDIETSREVCEVKVNCDRDSLYNAIGQLFVYSLASRLRGDYPCGQKEAVLFAYGNTKSNMAGVYNIMYAAQKMGASVYLVFRRRNSATFSEIEMMTDCLDRLADRYEPDRPQVSQLDKIELAMERIRLNLAEIKNVLSRRNGGRND